MAKAKQLTKSEIENLPWLHVYAQSYEHQPARIVGTPQGLIALRDAIDEALRIGTARAGVYASDGEGYSVEISRPNLINGLGQPEYLYQLEMKRQ